MLKTILYLLFLLFFNLLFFLIGGVSHIMSVWISYSFIHLSYLCLGIVSLAWKHYQSNIILFTPIFNIGVTYFILTLIWNIIIILIAPNGYKFNLVANLIMLFMYLLFTIIFIIVNKRIENKG